MLCPRRILIYGVAGSGKSTLAKRISELTNIPWHDMDALAWQPDWVATDSEHQRRIVEGICDTEAWVLDTAYSNWRDVPFERADLVIALDYSRWISLRRLLQRTLRRINSQETVWSGNRETYRRLFSKRSIVLYHFTSYGRKKRIIRSWASNPKVMRHRSPRETEEWLRGIGRDD